MIYFLTEFISPLRVYLGVFMIVSSLCIIGLLMLLNKMLNEQIEEQLKRFSDKAKIPRALRKRIGIRIKWR